MNKHQMRGLIFLAAGILLVLCGLGIHLAQQQEDAVAGQTAAILLQYLDDKTVPVIIDTNMPSQDSIDPVLPQKTYMGYHMIGSIEVPSVDVRLPVLGDWSEELLKVAPCRYQGNISDGNLIIMGHNYKAHFNPLHKVSVGAEVEFENAVGRIFCYRVAKIEKLHRTQGELLPSDEYPLTIFTCSPGGLERVVLRCELVK